MARYIFLMECKKGSEQEYIKRHKEVHPELLEALKEVGISNYSIFMNGNQLYAYMEVANFEEAMAKLENNPANITWQKYMSDILAMDRGNNPKMHLIDQEVFYLD
ncbi:L-rhamnose mutarotase [Aquibacillus saliphilus]|uniref:L-rhamnose mutarotase n=1 Tax=Aquibacillus saliphilus TaxID=1909422 RepID=UPI001CEFE78B|nr:L-rhamnose mutarotase [Aquibacillus saliphilus]